jgi:hypothetical protein
MLTLYHPFRTRRCCHPTTSGLIRLVPLDSLVLFFWHLRCPEGRARLPPKLSFRTSYPVLLAYTAKYPALAQCHWPQRCRKEYRKGFTPNRPLLHPYSLLVHQHCSGQTRCSCRSWDTILHKGYPELPNCRPSRRHSFHYFR